MSEMTDERLADGEALACVMVNTGDAPQRVHGQLILDLISELRRARHGLVGARNVMRDARLCIGRVHDAWRLLNNALDDDAPQRKRKIVAAETSPKDASGGAGGVADAQSASDLSSQAPPDSEYIKWSDTIRDYMDSGFVFNMKTTLWGFECSTCALFQVCAAEDEAGVTVEEAEARGWQRIHARGGARPVPTTPPTHRRNDAPTPTETPATMR